MQKIIDFFKKIFGVNVQQSIEAKQTKDTTIHQTANIYNFLIPGLILAAALAALAFWGYNEYQKSKYNFSPMASGKLNVVVVPFSNQTKGQCDASKDIGSLVASAFYSGLAAGTYDDTSRIQPAFRSPEEVPELAGKNEDDLTKSAEAFAKRINSQIVVYGIITCTEITQKPTAKVMFFVAPSGFSDAQELIGQFSFSSGALYGNLSSGEEFLSSNQNLQQKINIMSLVVNALGSYLGENYSQALETISTAVASPLWESEGGKEVVLIIAGNIELRYAQQLNLGGQEEQALKEIEQGQAFYILANDISKSEGKGEYARAFVGLAAIEHFYATYKSNASCKFQDIDLTKFELEKERLNSAESAKNSPLTADVPLKVAFNKAQIDLALYGMNPGSVSLEDIAKNYNLVISAYTNTKNPNLRVLEMAGHSYAGLGFVNWYNGNDKAAEANFTLAIETTETPSLQAGYLKSFGNYYYIKKKDYKKALIYYKEALNILDEFNIKQANCDSDLRQVIEDTEKKITQ